MPAQDIPFGLAQSVVACPTKPTEQPSYAKFLHQRIYVQQALPANKLLRYTQQK